MAGERLIGATTASLSALSMDAAVATSWLRGVLQKGGPPLYGSGAPPSFAPMMRQTSAVIDRAGNIWTINSYKTDIAVDSLLNPGGDGIVVFVGLARPPSQAPSGRR
jgi:hypothetical protein